MSIVVTFLSLFFLNYLFDDLITTNGLFEKKLFVIVLGAFLFFLIGKKKIQKDSQQ